jgi:hypothetical protein
MFADVRQIQSVQRQASRLQLLVVTRNAIPVKNGSLGKERTGIVGVGRALGHSNGLRHHRQKYGVSDVTHVLVRTSKVVQSQGGMGFPPARIMAAFRPSARPLLTMAFMPDSISLVRFSFYAA